MDPLKAERRALRWFVLSLVTFIVAAVVAPKTSGPWPWLVPLSVSFSVMLWFRLWRHHRAQRIARSIKPG